MPFAPPDLPSLKISTLKAELTTRGVVARTHYFNVSFFGKFGVRSYRSVIGDIVGMKGDLLFSGPLFERSRDRVEDVGRDAGLEEAFGPGHADRVCRFLNDCAESVVAHRPLILVFPATLQSYQQTTSSIALAKYVKRLTPEVTTILGGECGEGIMGVEALRQFDCLDFVVSGEGDIAMPELIENLLDEKDCCYVQGIYTRANACSIRHDEELVNAEIVLNLDTLPMPDHRDYFAQVRAAGMPEFDIVTLETSRGCWWTRGGNWCKFCSFFGKDAGFRSKSARRAIREFEYLVREYKPSLVLTADFVLNLRFFKDLIPMLAERDLQVGVFYEVRADLTKKQIQQLALAGVNRIQVGAESLSSAELRRMNKGTTALKNIQLLKWAHEHGIQVRWNILIGLPNATETDQRLTEERLAQISHFGAHFYAIEFVLQRYSPYYKEREEHFAAVWPARGYAKIYEELSAETISNLAYNYEFQSKVSSPDVAGHRNRLTALQETWRGGGGGALLHVETPEQRMLVFDLRPLATQCLTELDEVESFVITCCDGIQTQSCLRNRGLQRSISSDELTQALDQLVERKILLRDGDSYIALSVPLLSAVLDEKTLDLIVRRCHEEEVLQILLDRLGFTLPSQPPPRITAAGQLLR